VAISLQKIASSSRFDEYFIKKISADLPIRIIPPWNLLKETLAL